MKTYLYPDKKDWQILLQRPTYNISFLTEKVKNILSDVKQNGDAALKKYTQQFDGVELENFLVTEKEIVDAETLLSTQLKQAIQTAANNISTFHKNKLQILKLLKL